VNAAASFSIAIKQQLEMLASSPSPTVFAANTIAYAEAKTAYCQALRAAMPQLINIATGRASAASRAGQVCHGIRARWRKTEDGGGPKDDDFPKAIFGQSWCRKGEGRI
jgi:hypothetical protein